MIRCDIYFNKPNSIMVWKQKDDIFTKLRLYNKIHYIYAAQGLDGINEMIGHIKKMYSDIKA